MAGNSIRRELIDSCINVVTWFSLQEMTLRRVFEQELGIPTEGQTVLITDHLLSSKESREKTADVSDSYVISGRPFFHVSDHISQVALKLLLTLRLSYKA